jgi:tetratricopeptide (TPR) repeat protein
MVGDFMGAYFNTYYNAQKTFNEAEDQIWNQPELKQAGAGRNYLAQFNVTQDAKTKFASVIEKCSKLLEYHPMSNLVDDALMMIGKSYFYQSDYKQAERKFSELLSGYPESNLVLEARMLLAYSYYKEGNRSSAISTANDLLEAARKEEDDNIIAYTSLLLAQMDLEDKNYSLALQHYNDAAATAKTKEQRTFAWLNAADMYSKIGDYAKAQEAFAQANKQSPNYQGEYKGEIGVARMLAKQGKFDESMELLRDLRSDMKYKEFFGEIELEIANDYRDQGNLGQAVQQYRYVDTAYARTEWSANSYYQLGLLYEMRAGLYDSARVAYTKGKTEAPQTSLVAPLLARRADYMNKYNGFTAEIDKMDSLRAYWLAPHDSSTARQDSVVQDSLQETKTARADSAKPKQVSRPPLPLDSVLTRLALAKSELAALFYVSIGQKDSALFWYNKLIEDHPLSPLVPRAIFTIAQIYTQDSTVSKSVVDSLYRQLVDHYPRTPFAAEARRALGLPAVNVSPDTAETLYHMAEEAMLAGRNEHAIDTLNLIVQSFPASTYAPRAEYAAGWIYEQVLDVPDSAIATYQRLRARYPSSPFTARVQPKLLEVELRDKAVADSLARIQKAAADSLAGMQKVAADSLARAHKVPADSLARVQKAAADSLARNHKVPVDSLARTEKVHPDSLVQRDKRPADLKEQKGVEDDVPVNKGTMQLPPAGDDSTRAPGKSVEDTTETRRTRREVR